jgi:shikimate 5-dehydrogenase
MTKSRSTTQKRSLRIVQRLGTVPAVAVCTYCATNFKVPLAILNRTPEAQESLRKQFEEHKCERVDASQAEPQATVAIDNCHHVARKTIPV